MTDLDQYSTEGTSLSPAVRQKAAIAARDALEKARLLQPYLASFLGATRLLQSEKIGDTFAVSPNLILVYNPMFVLGLNDAGKGMTSWELGIGFLHESLHIVFKHQKRWETYSRKNGLEADQANRQAWNIAGDCEINVLLRKVHPVNPIYERIARGIFIQQAGLSTDQWNRLGPQGRGNLVRKKAKATWSALPEEDQYIKGMAEDWPHDGVSLPPWFCFPETALDPPQNDQGTAEDYFPYVRRRTVQPPGPPGGPQPPPPPQPPWEGYSIGDRIVNEVTGEEAEVVWAGPYNADNDPPQEVQVVVTNHWTEGSRTVQQAEEIGAIARAKAEAGITPEDEANIARKVRADNRKRAREGEAGRAGYTPIS